MVHDYKSISVFIDPNDTLFIQSASFSEKYGSLSNELITELRVPYSDAELEKALEEGLHQYDSIPVNEDLKSSPLAAYFGKKSHDAVVKNKRLVHVSWTLGEGYICMPMKKVKRGHQSIDKLTINVPTDFKSGELAQAVRKAIELSYIEV